MGFLISRAPEIHCSPLQVLFYELLYRLQGKAPQTPGLF